jgi:hypothetical protein
MVDCLENQFTHYDDHEHWVEAKAQLCMELSIIILWRKQIMWYTEINKFSEIDMSWMTFQREHSYT